VQKQQHNTMIAPSSFDLSQFVAIGTLPVIIFTVFSFMQKLKLRLCGMQLYHCTSQCSASAIKRNGFRCGTSGIVGGGIYFAVSVKDAIRKAHQKGVVLQCRVDVGRVYDVGFNGDISLNLTRINRLGYNSVRIARNGEPGTEYCVYEPSRVSVIGEHRDQRPWYQLLVIAALAAVLVAAAVDGKAVGFALSQCYRALAASAPHVLKALDRFFATVGKSASTCFVKACYAVASALANAGQSLVANVPGVLKTTHRIIGLAVVALGTKVFRRTLPLIWSAKDCMKRA